MTPKISVIIPVYQVEKYLETCVESVLAQTVNDLEIILVDDGSTDNSGKIADQYAEQYDNIKVIHKQNAGLGEARNSGIAAATGDYIGFIDSDDWIAPRMYEKLYAAALCHDADIVISGHTTVTNGMVMQRKVHPLAGKILTEEIEINEMRRCLYGHGVADQYKNAFPTSVCMSLYRREMVRKNALKFLSTLSEDTFFNLQAYQCTKRIAVTDGTDYFYRRDGQSSISASYSEGTVAKYIDYLERLLSLAMLEDVSCELRVQRNAVDYCRMFVGNIANSKLKYGEKVTRTRVFMENEKLRRFWQHYPVKYLPIQQRIFQILLMSKKYGTALFLHGVKTTARNLVHRITLRQPSDGIG